MKLWMCLQTLLHIDSFPFKTNLARCPTAISHRQLLESHILYVPFSKAEAGRQLTESREEWYLAPSCPRTDPRKTQKTGGEASKSSNKAVGQWCRLASNFWGFLNRGLLVSARHSSVKVTSSLASPALSRSAHITFPNNSSKLSSPSLRIPLSL